MIKQFGKALPYALAGAIAMNTFTGCGISKNVESPVAIQELEFEDIEDSGKIEPIEPQEEIPKIRKLELVDDIYIDLDEFDDIRNDEDQTSMEHIDKLSRFVSKYNLNTIELLEEFENIIMAKEVSLSDFSY